MLLVKKYGVVDVGWLEKISCGYVVRRIQYCMDLKLGSYSGIKWVWRWVGKVLGEYGVVWVWCCVGMVWENVVLGGYGFERV